MKVPLHRLELGILRAEHRRARLEGGGVGGRPPVAQRAGGVDGAALVVEAVGQLMADDTADRAIIERRVGVGIEDRRLQDRRREDDVAQ